MSSQIERGEICGEVMGKLTAATAKSLSKPGLHDDGATLYLNLAAGGSKSWIQRVTIDGRRRDHGLGPYPAVSLAQARRRAADNRAAIADGRDPLAEKRRAALLTLRQAAEMTFEATRPRWHNAKHTKNWMQGLEKYAFPVIGDLRVDRILREDVLRILTPIWATRPETARKLVHELASLGTTQPGPTVSRKKTSDPAPPSRRAASKVSATSTSAKRSPRSPFSGEALKAHRERLGLSADNDGKFLGASGLSIYNWEQRKTRPRKSSVDAWTAIRRIGKREAPKRLAILEAAGPKSESRQKPAEK